MIVAAYDAKAEAKFDDKNRYYHGPMFNCSMMISICQLHINTESTHSHHTMLN